PRWARDVACPLQPESGLVEGANQGRRSRDRRAKNRDQLAKRALGIRIDSRSCRGKSRVLRCAPLRQNPTQSEQRKNSAPCRRLAWRAWRIRGKEKVRLSILCDRV